MKFLYTFLLTLLLLNFTLVANSNEKKIITTIKPIHSILLNIVDSDVELLLNNNSSPHDFKLKPSDMKKITDSDVLIYIDESIESFIERPVNALGEDTKIIKILGNADLSLLPIREGGVWEEEDHGDHHEHNHGAYDAHIWLGTKNVIKLTKFFVKELSKISPDKKNIYKANAKEFIKKVSKTNKDLSAKLDSVNNEPYIVFHDAYQYFEADYSLNSVGSISLNPDISPTPNRIQEIKSKIEKDNVVCLFREPQFPSRIVQTVIQETNAKEGELDPLGFDLTPGKNLYFELVTNLSKNLRECLSKGG
tara:strand:- start:236 stop:1156 length:921 start_codon:yes stop_codon:yes gene_type:complete